MFPDDLCSPDFDDLVADNPYISPN